MKIELKVDNNVDVPLQVKEEMISVEGNYNKLKYLPTLNGEEIKGNINETDPTVPAWAKSESKPNYSAKETGAVEENSVITLEELKDLFETL